MALQTSREFDNFGALDALYSVKGFFELVHFALFFRHQFGEHKCFKSEGHRLFLQPLGAELLKLGSYALKAVHAFRHYPENNYYISHITLLLKSVKENQQLSLAFHLLSTPLFYGPVNPHLHV